MRIGTGIQSSDNVASFGNLFRRKGTGTVRAKTKQCMKHEDWRKSSHAESSRIFLQQTG
jgi:hypothetical protein